MNVVGLVLEFLFPGAIVLIAVGIIAWEVAPDDVGSLATTAPALFLAAGAIVAYLVGIVLRHYSLLPAPAKHYRERLSDSWTTLAPKLHRRLGRWSQQEVAVQKESANSQEGNQDLGEQQSHDLVSYLRDWVLANKADAVADYLMYQWRLARLARNCHVPLLIALGVCLSGVGIRAAGCDGIAAAYYGLGALSTGAALLAIGKVYRERLYWHVDILMRLADMEFASAPTE